MSAGDAIASKALNLDSEVLADGEGQKRNVHLLNFTHHDVVPHNGHVFLGELVNLVPFSPFFALILNIWCNLYGNLEISRNASAKIYQQSVTSLFGGLSIQI